MRLVKISKMQKVADKVIALIDAKHKSGNGTGGIRDEVAALIEKEIAALDILKG